ncbi:hypothetical protein SMC26_08775 [Actinomadura fulvescens]|uniref:hypothetical protein n=1 Tax=Actinomadura fulvescens TaxID=46160 RepID=UPI0031E0B4D2
MTNLLAADLDYLTSMIKHRLTTVQHHPEVIDGCTGEIMLAGIPLHPHPWGTAPGRPVFGRPDSSISVPRCWQACDRACVPSQAQ